MPEYWKNATVSYKVYVFQEGPKIFCGHFYKIWTLLKLYWESNYDSTILRDRYVMGR